MNFETMQNLLTIASAPIVDVNEPLPIEVTPAGQQNHQIRRWKNGRNWAVYAETGELIAVVVYKKGAREIVRRLNGNNQ